MSPIFITALVALAALFLAGALVFSEWLIRRDGRGADGDDDSSARS